ncbi:MAG: aldo/keto reductase, partial [Betaproteobacteria bacterium]|nr:aldo/keto reductase [Betaproteobacteria bacterium]
SPLARGVLTGKYKPGQTPAPDSRAARGDKRILQTEFRPESLAMSQAFETHARSRGMSATQLAIAWVLNNRLVHGVIGGPKTFTQWQDYLSACVGHHPHAVMVTTWQQLGLDESSGRAVGGLAHNGGWHPHAASSFNQTGHTPATEIGQAVVADLAHLDETGKGREHFLDGRALVIPVHVVHIDPVGAQAAQAVVYLTHDPAPRQAPIVGLIAHGVGHLGGHDPALTISGNQLPQHALGGTARVIVRGVHGVYARLAAGFDHAPGFIHRGLIPKHHRAQPQGRRFEAAMAERSIGNGCHTNLLQ